MITELLTSTLFLQTLLAFILGMYGALVCRIAFKPGRAFTSTLILLPPVVCVALLIVNGSVGTSIAVLGVFGLVRFRSLPGKSTDMVCVLFAMVLGLLAAAGAWVESILLSLVLGLMILAAAWFMHKTPKMTQVQIVVPESSPQEELYENLLAQYGKKIRLEKIRTTGMGTLYELDFSMELDSAVSKSALLDEIRRHNSNLAVTLFTRDEDAQAL